jgi:transcription elongation factor Elf1
MDLEEFADPTFRLYRQYDKLVRRGLANPIRCKVDNTRLTTLLTVDDELALKCFNCGSLVTPGSKDIDAVKKVVDEYLE